jgi:1-acylglycerone phosphate reductase
MSKLLSVISIGLIVAWTSTPWPEIYYTTKACVESLSNVLRMELKGKTKSTTARSLPAADNQPIPGFGIDVSFVAPGAIKSAIGASDDKRTILKPTTPSTPT